MTTTYHLNYPRANGAMTIKMPVWGLGLDLTFIGGPYVRNEPDMTDSTFGVCLVEHIEPEKHWQVHMPIPDFSVPEDSVEDVSKVIQAAIIAAMQGKDVFFGCLGGWGRTGLALSLVAKFLGMPDPIGFVRKNYTPRAVETREQERYVKDFPVPDTNMWFLSHALAAKTRMIWERAAAEYDAA